MSRRIWPSRPFKMSYLETVHHGIVQFHHCKILPQWCVTFGIQTNVLSYHLILKTDTRVHLTLSALSILKTFYLLHAAFSMQDLLFWSLYLIVVTLPWSHGFIFFIHKRPWAAKRQKRETSYFSRFMTQDSLRRKKKGKFWDQVIL